MSPTNQGPASRQKGGRDGGVRARAEAHCATPDHLQAAGGNGENSAYIKAHIEGSEYEWDFGLASRPRNSWAI
jgi:hypothetical protein